MPKWKGKQVAFDLENEEENSLHEFAKTILFTPIMKQCLRLIKNGILKVYWTENGLLEISWNGKQKESLPTHYETIPTPQETNSSITLNHITQSDSDIDEFCL